MVLVRIITCAAFRQDACRVVVSCIQGCVGVFHVICIAPACISLLPVLVKVRRGLWHFGQDVLQHQNVIAL